jgi:hypothetical protein
MNRKYKRKGELGFSCRTSLFDCRVGLSRERFEHYTATCFVELGP